MPDIGPDSYTQTNEQTDKVKGSIFASLIGLPGWIKIVASICVGLWCINFAFGLMPIENRGTFGDTFGAVNSLFSALALLGVAWSISMQREATSEATRERKIAQETLDKQQENSSLQRFENTFFQLFSAFNAVVNDLKVVVIKDQSRPSMLTAASYGESFKGEYIGRDVFPELLKSLRVTFDSHYDARVQDGYPPTYAYVSEIFQESYSFFLEYEDEEFDRYLRTFYTVVRFINRSPIGADQKEFYYHFLRAQLSKSESNLLVLHYATKNMPSDICKVFLEYAMASNADVTDRLIADAEDVPVEIFGTNVGQKYEQMKFSRDSPD